MVESEINNCLLQSKIFVNDLRIKTDISSTYLSTMFGNIFQMFGEKWAQTFCKPLSKTFISNT